VVLKGFDDYFMNKINQPVNSSEENKNLPPMLKQYIEYKKKHPDCLVLFQVGDFYEVFFDDAVLVAEALNITLTSRDKNSPNPIPMCGVPISVVDSYVSRLVAKGFSAAIVAQQEVASGYKGMVPRSLIKVVTPGVQIFNESEQASSILASFYFETSENGSVAFTDLQSGLVSVKEGMNLEELSDFFESLEPNEIVGYPTIGDFTLDKRSLIVRRLEALTKNPLKWRKDSYLTNRAFDDLVGFIELSNTGKRAARLLLGYLQDTTVNVKNSNLRLTLYRPTGTLLIDAKTQANLELVTNRYGSSNNTLFNTVNETVTSNGKRLLKRWLQAPLLDIERIERRSETVRYFVLNPLIRYQVRTVLAKTADLNWIATRIGLGIATPRELGALRDTLQQIPYIISCIKQSEPLPNILASYCEKLSPPSKILPKLESSLKDELPAQINLGGIIRHGFSPEVDRLRSLKEDGNSWFESFAARERELTGISSLKVKSNNIIGFFIEVSINNSNKVPKRYELRQSTVNSRRYIVPELKEAERDFFTAYERSVEIERQLFISLRQSLVRHVLNLRKIAELLSSLDVLLSFAEVSAKESYVEPKLTNSLLEIKNGRHPVVQNLLGPSFVPNSLNMSGEESHPCRSFLLTGPNMGGKSTFLRQTALIVILAQCGCFVPAQEAVVGIVDRIFARIGASDNLADGESTFMVEMKEAALIVSNATSQSLVLIDEIGRGTSTVDGLAIAKAIFEWIIKKTKARVIFATHYHELADCCEELGFTNISVGSVRENGEIIFTHSIVGGSASKSYGLEVARIAGLPPSLVDRAREFINLNGAKEICLPPVTNILNAEQPTKFRDKLNVKTIKSEKQIKTNIFNGAKQLSLFNESEYPCTNSARRVKKALKILDRLSLINKGDFELLNYRSLLRELLNELGVKHTPKKTIKFKTLDLVNKV
jgi:DNA mismatch repair protein MutS